MSDYFCQRWKHSLAPEIKKCAWSSEEDQLLIKLHREHGPKWAVICDFIPGRTDDACSKRYREALDPALKRAPWTPEEDARLISAFERLGSSWVQIGQILGRGGLDCRNSPAATSAPLSALPVEGPDLMNNWPPYYPPEMYPLPSSGESSHTHVIRESTPEHHVTVSPHVAPFNFSSSSLSTALSAPLRSKPLPSDNSDAVRPSHHRPLFHSQSQPQSQATSPLILNGTINTNTQDIVMSQDDTIDTTMDNTDNGSFLGLQQFDNFSFTGPLQSLPFPFPSKDVTFPEPAINHAVSPISPSVVNLPEPLQFGETDQPATQGSLLFSVAPPGPIRTRKPPVQSQRKATPRLSSTLRCSDPNIRPYACGYESCWSEADPSKRVCFYTSGELNTHIKEVHTSDKPVESPWRCGLEGCRQKYKSENGIQYHLQASKVHFQDAVQSFLSQHSTAAEASQDPSSSPGKDPEKKQRRYMCPRPGCVKAFKQASGLRYHLAHGHPSSKPVQIAEMPPEIRNAIPKPIRNLRQKSPELPPALTTAISTA
ncbi:hypothetical protein CC1G_10287 [Coprinopsis cinerea okayama7|uniref:C2H2-type domain-containing protein n=1 Tax=Coprinopsis cinerea (strain Okayama-7 / 130 / ATCC MYA-4618 / FGSC 9003) TaxID=240176 RepID=A8N166_COPC7|nr:hypothetical protein CC1G_10287 [Coprinopsis cinerea okayama7\|eukprot:XP_001828616.2 hypothetical protein CC1G_10287 [Coprinopsis cinerea okayama7\